MSVVMSSRLLSLFFILLLGASVVSAANDTNETTVILTETNGPGDLVFLGLLFLPFLAMIVGYVIRVPVLVALGGVFLAIVTWIPVFADIFAVPLRVIFTIAGLSVLYASIRMTPKAK